MLKIGDFSRLAQVTVKALRLYDERGLLRPVHVDGDSGYRYYSSSQLPSLHRILALKDLGFALDEIEAMLHEAVPPREFCDLLASKREAMRHQLTETQARLNRLETRLTLIEQECIVPDIVLKSLPVQQALTLRQVIPHYGSVAQLFEQLFPFAMQHRVALAGPPMALYHDPEYRDHDMDVEVVVPVAGPAPEHPTIRVRELPAVPKAACMIHQGPYTGFIESYQALMTWIDAQGYRIAGECREIYLCGPNDERDPSRYLTEILIPVTQG
jgi:effector-binding domain-containing protein